LALLLAHVGEAIGGQVSGRWEPSLLYRARYLIVAMWALVPLFGGVCLFFHWLFQLGEANENKPNDPGEKPG